MMDPGCSDLNKKCLPWSWAVEHLVPSWCGTVCGGLGVALLKEICHWRWTRA